MCAMVTIKQVILNSFKRLILNNVHDHILDLVITRNSYNIISSTSVETLLTDHHVIQCDVVTQKPKRPRRQARYRKYTTIDNLIDLHAPLITRVIIIQPKTPWYNSELSDAKQQLRRAERRWPQTCLLVHTDIYTSLRDVYRETLVAAKSSFFCEKIRESACDVKAIYRVTNEITGRKQPPVLPECNDSHEDLAERFREHFFEKMMTVRSTMHHDAPLRLLPIDNNHHHHCPRSTICY